MAKNSEYINVDKILTIEGRPSVAGTCYHTNVFSQILHVIMEPTLFFIKHILKDSFDFIDRKFNYFYINKNFFHQIKGTAMGTIFAVVRSSLTVAYFEVKMFALLRKFILEIL